MLKSTLIKLLLLTVVLASSLNTLTIKAFVPDGAGSGLQRAIAHCKQVGGKVNPIWDYIAGSIVHFGELVSTGRFAFGPNCWCGVIPVDVLKFTSCNRYNIYQIPLLATISVIFLLTLRRNVGRRRTITGSSVHKK